MGVSIFEDKQGYVVAAKGTAATRALLRISGLWRQGEWSGLNTANVFFLTGLHLEKGVNNSVAYTLDNHIFLSAAGDRLGAMRLTGMIFGSSCGNGGVDFKDDHGGIRWLLNFYKEHRLLGNNSQRLRNSVEALPDDSNNVPRIEVFYRGMQDRCIGLVSGVASSTSSFSHTAMDFSLDCLLIP